MPKDSPFPDDEPRGFQVWHKQGRHYEHVATVESNALGALMMTNHGFMGYARWQDNPRASAMPGEHRSTTIGDVLIGRDGQSLEIAADKELGLRLKPIAPVDQSPSDAKEHRPGQEQTPLERVERQLRDWKNDHSSLWGSAFNEAGRLRVLEGELDWTGVAARDKQAIIAREVDFTKMSPEELEAAYQPSARSAVFDGGVPEETRRQFEAAQRPDIRVLPGKDNPLSWRDDRSFDIHDATGKIGYLTGHMGGPWSEREFRVTHLEISAPDRKLSPGEWKEVLHGLREHLSGEAELVGGNRGGEGGDLHPAYEKLLRLPPAERLKEHRPAATPDPAHRAQFQQRDDAQGHDR